MGRVIRSEIIAIRCELRSCAARVAVEPMRLRADWQLQEVQLERLVDQGWALVLTPQLRSYCPVHAARVWNCSCRTNPDRVHLCVVHDVEAAELVRAPSRWSGLGRRAVA